MRNKGREGSVNKNPGLIQQGRLNSPLDTNNSRVEDPLRFNVVTHPRYSTHMMLMPPSGKDIKNKNAFHRIHNYLANFNLEIDFCVYFKAIHLNCAAFEAVHRYRSEFLKLPTPRVSVRP